MTATTTTAATARTTPQTSYVRNAWYVAAWAHDVGDTPFAAKIMGEPLALWRKDDGALVVFEDRCPHRLAPLSLGRCEGARLRCMYHGLLFDETGKCVEIPGQDMIPPAARARAYPAVERHQWCWVWMGDPEQADESLIPNVWPLDPDQGWLLGTGILDYESEARLICDNLIDLSHLSYVHPETFGTTESWATISPKISALPRGVRYELWLEDQPNMVGGGGGRIDPWTTYDMLVPGVFMLRNTIFPLGTAKACNYEAPGPDVKPLFDAYTCQAATPTGDRTARYFYSWGPHSSVGNEDVRDHLMVMAKQAFAEDQRMIEGQQRVLDATEDPRVIPTAGDRPVVMYNQLINRLVRAEQGGEAAA